MFAKRRWGLPFSGGTLSGSLTVTNTLGVTSSGAATITIKSTGANRSSLKLNRDDALAMEIFVEGLSDYLAINPYIGTGGVIIPEGSLTFGGVTQNVAKTFIEGDNAKPFALQKSTIAASAVGANRGMLRWEAGTNPGTLKLIAYSGTSTTGVTIVDNVGLGN